jgi:Ubiquitin family
MFVFLKTCLCSALHNCSFLSFQIFIKTLTGRKQAFNFEPENQVLAVKQALQEKEGIQVDQIRLIHSGKQLADDKTLESYNIGAGATIHMVLQLRGGARRGNI